MSLAKRKRKEQKGGLVDGARPAMKSAESTATTGSQRKPLAAVRKPDKRSTSAPKPVQEKRPLSPYKPAQAAMAPPPADELLRLEDFLPPLPDEEGDGLDRSAGSGPGSKPGRVLGYEGDQPPQPPRPLEKPRTAKPPRARMPIEPAAIRQTTLPRRAARKREVAALAKAGAIAAGPSRSRLARVVVRQAAKKFGKPAGKFGRKFGGRCGDRQASGGGKPTKRGKGKRR